MLDANTLQKYSIDGSEKAFLFAANKLKQLILDTANIYIMSMEKQKRKQKKRSMKLSQAAGMARLAGFGTSAARAKIKKVD